MDIVDYLNVEELWPCPVFHGFDGLKYKRGNLKTDLKIKQSNDGCSRNFWCLKISCDCGFKTNWFIVSEQDAIEPDQEKINEVVKLWNKRRNRQ